MNKKINKFTGDLLKTNKILTIFIIISFFLISTMFIFTKVVFAQHETPTPTTQEQTGGIGWPEAVKIAIGFISAALATGMGSFAAGKAVSMVGSAAMGAVAEKPEILGRSLIFVGLAEGVAIYGLIISIIILGSL